ncbi:MAG: tyrosine-type recombinase/integrase [Pseudomonadota bacterium]
MVFSVQEVSDLLVATPGHGLKYRAALSISFGAGLRASEVCNLKVSDSDRDSDRMLIHVDQGKGGEDRKVMLSPGLLGLMRAYWKEARPQNSGASSPPDTPCVGSKAHHGCPLKRGRITSAKHMVGIRKPSTRHTLWHSFATHPLEANTDVRVVRILLGHAKLTTTARYTHVATKTIKETVFPDEMLASLQDQTLRRSLE